MMQTVNIDIDRAKARELYREYKAHRHYMTPVDDEIRRAYKEIAQGKVVIRALESIKAAGLNARGLPNLAIARADLSQVHFEPHADGGGVFMSNSERRIWRRHGTRQNSARIRMPRDSFPRSDAARRGRALLPLIPAHLRPRHAIEKYHILWEAEWEPVPPRDPYLLRRIGKADLWLVCAAWDLTEVERAALATRAMVQ